jgi:hypothetical protein
MTMSGAALFLDTTIQIERVVGSRARQAELRRELANYHLTTSTYVLGEYLRTLVKDAILLHKLTLEHKYLDDIMTAIAQYPNKRVSSRMLLLWANVYRRGRYDEQDILDQLDDYITFWLVNRFVTGIDELLDVTECGLARERPAAVGESYHLRNQCTRRIRECVLAERLSEWQPELQAVADGLRDHPDSALARIGALAAHLLDEPDLVRGRNCTWYLGDLIIALELFPEIPFYTTNRRHFEPLCALLGKRLFHPKKVDQGKS